MTTNTQPQALIAHLPEQLPDVSGLPTAQRAAQRLFEQQLPGLLAHNLYVLQFEVLSAPALPAPPRIVSVQPLDSLVQRARLGIEQHAQMFDADHAVLSSSDTAVVVPDLDDVPSLAQLQQALKAITPETSAAQFAVDELTYWDVPSSSDFVSGRLRQEVALRDALSGQANLLGAFGELSDTAVALVEAIVQSPRFVDRTVARGVYSLAVQAQGSSETFTVPGMLALTLKPAGYSPAQGIVVDRQALTGETVVFSAGYFGFVSCADNLASALELFARQLAESSFVLAAMLARLAPEDQVLLLRERERPGCSFNVLAKPIDDNPFALLAEQQIAAWRLNALSDSLSCWNSRIGLDASSTKRCRALQALKEQHQALRGQLPEGLRNLSAAKQAQLDQLLQQQGEQQTQAERHFADLPTFHEYARDRIVAALRNDGLEVDPDALGFTISITALSPEVIESELAPGANNAHAHRDISDIYCTLLEYITMRMDAKVDAFWTVEPVGMTPEQSSYLTLAKVNALAAQLPLQDDYQELIRARLQSPTDVPAQPAFEQSRQAAVEVFETRVRIDALVAQACGELDASGYQLILDVLDYPDMALRPLRGRGPAQLEGLVLSGNSVRDVYLFRLSGESSIVCYLPGHPSGRSFYRYRSSGALRTALTLELKGIASMQSDDWSNTARYWVTRFGQHQLAQVMPLLVLMAKGQVGSELSTVQSRASLGKTAFAYRVRYLLSEGDNQAVSAYELSLQQWGETALLVFRLISIIVPARIMTVLDLAELGYYLFNSFSAYTTGQRQHAGDYMLEALTSLNGLANAKFFKRRQRAEGASPMRLKLDAGKVSIEPVAMSKVAPDAMQRLGSGVRKGLFVGERKLHALLDDGRYYPAYEIFNPLEGTYRHYLGEGSSALSRSLFSNPDPRIIRDRSTGQWLLHRRPGLRGGMEPQAVARTPSSSVFNDVQITRVDSADVYNIHSEGQLVPVLYDLKHGCWYSLKEKLYYRFDHERGRYRADPQSGPVSTEMERYRVRQEFSCPARPVLPAPRGISVGEPIARTVHHIWIGTASALIDAHGTALRANAQLAAQSDFSLQVNFLGQGGMLPTSMQLIQLRSKFPGVTFVDLKQQPHFRTFRASKHGKVFDFFLNPQTRNYAAACDVLRYRLLFDLGGIYMDVDDRLLKPLPDLILHRGQLAVGDVIISDMLNFRGFNNSHFATLSDNPLLDAMLEEINRRFTASTRLGARPLRGQPGFEAYMGEISKVTGPALFNDMVLLSNPRAQGLREAKLYVNDLFFQKVIAEPDIDDWIAHVREEISPLDDVIEVGSTGSWGTGR